jgi:hypothetical protein
LYDTVKLRRHKLGDYHFTVAVEEIISPKAEGETEDFFTKYVKLYNYYDDNAGSRTMVQVFYTVARMSLTTIAIFLPDNIKTVA